MQRGRSSLGRLAVWCNDANSGITSVDRTSAAAYAAVSFTCTGARLRKIGDVAVEESIILEEWRDNTLHEGLIGIKVIGYGRLELIGGQIEDVFENKAANLGGRFRAQVEAEWDEIVEAFITSNFTGVKEKHCSCFHEGRGKGEWVSTAILGVCQQSSHTFFNQVLTYPVLRETFVEEERCDILIVGVGLVSTIWKTLVDEDSLCVRNSKPDSAGKELRIGVARVVVTEAVVLRVGHLIEQAAIVIGCVHVLVPSLQKEVCIVPEVNVLASNGPVNLEDTM